MYRLTIRKQDHSQEPVIHLMDPGPPADTSVFLDFLRLRKFDCVFNPFVLDYGTIWTTSAESEITRGFHPPFISKSLLTEKWALPEIQVRLSRKVNREEPGPFPFEPDVSKHPAQSIYLFLLVAPSLIAFCLSKIYQKNYT